MPPFTVPLKGLRFHHLSTVAAHHQIKIITCWAVAKHMHICREECKRVKSAWGVPGCTQEFFSFMSPNPHLLSPGSWFRSGAYRTCHLQHRIQLQAGKAKTVKNVLGHLCSVPPSKGVGYLDIFAGKTPEYVSSTPRGWGKSLLIYFKVIHIKLASCNFSCVIFASLRFLVI